jgi:hypothetical protein
MKRRTAGARLPASIVAAIDRSEIIGVRAGAASDRAPRTARRRDTTIEFTRRAVAASSRARRS